MVEPYYDSLLALLAFFLTGVARTESHKKIANIIDSDLQLVVHVDSGTKKVVSIADLVCNVCRSSGVTTLNLVEHDMLPKVQDPCLPTAFTGLQTHSLKFMILIVL